jgi:CheY-like chemotaxis protein
LAARTCGLGRTTVAAVDGVEALAELKRHVRPCLILLDLVMPRMDGWRFLEVLRNDASLKAIPVVVISAHANTHTPEGADGLIPKPLDLHELRQTVLQHCPDA